MTLSASDSGQRLKTSLTSADKSVNGRKRHILYQASRMRRISSSACNDSTVQTPENQLVARGFGVKRTYVRLLMLTVDLGRPESGVQ